MATAARHARTTAPAPRRDREPDPRLREQAQVYRASQRRSAARRSRLMRTFVVFVGCLTLLAVGRVALSFAVVQKTLQTDAIVREERRVSEQNARLQEEVAQLSSAPRIRHIAETQLGLVDATHILYPEPLMGGALTKVAANR